MASPPGTKCINLKTVMWQRASQYSTWMQLWWVRRQELDCFLFPFMLMLEPCRQRAAQPASLPGTEVPTVPGWGPALLRLNYTIRKEMMMWKVWWGLGRNVAGGSCSQVKCHQRVCVGACSLRGNFGQLRMSCLSSFLLCCNAFVLKPIASLHCRVVVRKMRGEQECSFNT